MKITKQQLKQIIKEELKEAGEYRHPKTAFGDAWVGPTGEEYKGALGALDRMFSALDEEPVERQSEFIEKVLQDVTDMTIRWREDLGERGQYEPDSS
jgi:hypothetical protein